MSGALSFGPTRRHPKLSSISLINHRHNHNHHSCSSRYPVMYYYHSRNVVSVYYSLYMMTNLLATYFGLN